MTPNDRACYRCGSPRPPNNDKFCSRECYLSNKRSIEDERIFSRRDSGTAYWAGFLMADGCVQHRESRNNSCLSVALDEEDRSHLEKLADFLGYTGAFVVDGTKVQIAVGSKPLLDDLSWWGVVPNKTYCGSLPELTPDLTPHYLRGLIDGDGGIYDYDQPQHRRRIWIVRLTGNEPVVNGVATLFSDEFGIRSSIWMAKHNSDIDHRTFVLSVQRREDVQTILRWLQYDGDTVALDRKRKTALTILESR